MLNDVLFLFLVNAKPQCESDYDCAFDQKCSQGNCVPACSLVNCGLNAICLPKNHRGICECIPGYFGNPTVACNKGMFISYYHSKFEKRLEDCFVSVCY